VSETALTREAEIAWRDDGLPNTFVPGRNLLFLMLAGVLAVRRGLRHLVGGRCETYHSGYPDCRDNTVKALQAALNLGMNTRLALHTPLMCLDKAETSRLAERLGGAALVEVMRAGSLSCCRGDTATHGEWGRGWPACERRARGWRRYASKP